MIPSQTEFGHTTIFLLNYDDKYTKTECKGNFLELVHLTAKYNPVLREHVLRIKLGGKLTTSYMSSSIQNEF